MNYLHEELWNPTPGRASSPSVFKTGIDSFLDIKVFKGCAVGAESELAHVSKDWLIFTKILPHH